MDTLFQEETRRTSSPWEGSGANTPSLAAEVYESGNVEYKLNLVNCSPERIEHLVTQLQWRLAEGNGEALYELGVGDDGTLPVLRAGGAAPCRRSYLVPALGCCDARFVGMS